MACHCAGCQRMTASAFSLSEASIRPSAFRLTPGEPVLGGITTGRSRTSATIARAGSTPNLRVSRVSSTSVRRCSTMPRTERPFVEVLLARRCPGPSSARRAPTTRLPEDGGMAGTHRGISPDVGRKEERNESAGRGQTRDRLQREAAGQDGRLGRRSRQRQDEHEPVRRDRGRGSDPAQGKGRRDRDRRGVDRPGQGAGDAAHVAGDGRRPRDPRPDR